MLTRKGAWRAALYLQSGLLTLMLAGLAGGAFAQNTTDPTPPNPAPTNPAPAATSDGKSPEKKTDDTTNVTVTAQKPLNRIDRQVYDNTKDPDSQTGTAADALNKVPGVSVDPQGNVILRGKSPQILINGKPSPMMSGDNRAAALLAMPSGSISSIEVINNPGAQFGSDSSGSGIINIVTRTTLPRGGSGALTGQVTSVGGYSSNLFGQYHTGKLSFTGTLSVREDPRNGNAGSMRRALDSNGDVLRSTDTVGRSDARSRNVFTSGSLAYDLSTTDSLTAVFNYMRSESSGVTNGKINVYNAADTATDLYSQAGVSRFTFETQSVGANWDHVGKTPGETLKVDTQVSRTLNGGLFSNLSLYSLSVLPANLAGLKTAFHNGTRADNERIGIDYTRPLGDDQVNAGLQIVRDGNTSHSESFGPDPASATTLTYNALFANQFIYSQVVSAAYVTYQKPFGLHWTVLGGLRAEHFELNADAATAHLTNQVDYTTYNPSLFATYVISDKARVRFSYSHRLVRPTAQDYNPATVLNSETSLSVGRANLKPQKTDFYEAGYEYSGKSINWSLRGYETRETGMIISVTSFVPDPLNLGNLVTSTARLNAGTRDTLGTEFVFSGKLAPQWSINANANLSNVDFRTLSFAGNPSLTGLAGRVSISYATKSKNDTIQAAFNVQPRLLSGQGYRSGYSAATVNWNHNLTSKLSLVFGVTDLLRSSKSINVTDTNTYYGTSYRSADAPVFTLSLRTRFGGNLVPPKTPPPGMTFGRSPG